VAGEPGDEPPITEALRAALGPPVIIRRLDSSERSRVWLAEFGGAPAIVKQATPGPRAAGRYHREVTALRLAGRLDPPVVPALLATEPGQHVLVLEYLTARRPAGDQSAGHQPAAGHQAADDQPAGDWAAAYATALARLHAVGQSASSRPGGGDPDGDGPDGDGPGGSEPGGSEPGGADPGAGEPDGALLPAWRGPGPDDVSAFLRLAAVLDVPVPRRLPGELGDLCGRLAAAGQHALLHGDPCPDNAIHTGSGIRFIDLESAALGSGCTELAYLWIGFPTCWCAKSVPAARRDEAEAAYRDTWRGITGEDPAGDLADACAGWLIRGDALVERSHRGEPGQFIRLPHEDWQWGVATARQRLLHRLAMVATLAAGHPLLGTLAQVSQVMAERIQRGWPGTGPLPAAPGNPLDSP
jgi:aminoglycoside phosphotransferase (APT) family kinase protein